ncbi:ABC transporter permease [Microbacterium sp. CFBP9034]|uniref:ABC transporter permease n=1 Tax=Microbacterium sp. CFBP9034 TaxID=3096540 RepID=UPI002A6A41CA|nr:ABC transporter permease [Microbacterium sp. CFBP9034]MDY0908982.1 ABC transporter permease [Microbacterium sp. CFBP9034]
MHYVTTIDLANYDVPGRGRGILDVFRWRYLLNLLVRKGTATRYRNSVLGWTWSYVKPAAQFAVYYFVMGFILGGHGIDNFAIYLFSGIVIINLFNEAFGNATTAIVDNGSLVRKIYLPRELFPIAAIIVAFVHFLPQVAILLVVCILVGWTPSLIGVGAVLLGTLIVVMFALGLGLFFSGINVRFRDAQNIVEIIRMFSVWTSPVLYLWVLVAEKLPAWMFAVYMSNPLAVAVELFHLGFWEPTATTSHGLPPSFGVYIAIALAICVASLLIGQSTFRRFERTFAQDL